MILILIHLSCLNYQKKTEPVNKLLMWIFQSDTAIRKDTQKVSNTKKKLIKEKQKVLLDANDGFVMLVS